MFTINGILFEWDPHKARKNHLKHHVSFANAARAFFDSNRLEAYDDTHSDDEDRYYLIGFADAVLFVVFTERQVRCKTVIRIISARIATTEEEKRYYENG